MSDSKTIVIFSTGSYPDIHLAAQSLENNGIESTIRNLDTQDLIGLGKLGTGVNPAVGSYELSVLEENADKALEILNGMLPRYTDTPAEEVQIEPGEAPESEAIPVKEEELAPPGRKPLPISSVIGLIALATAIIVLWANATLFPSPGNFLMNIVTLLFSLTAIGTNAHAGFRKKSGFSLIISIAALLILFGALTKIMQDREFIYHGYLNNPGVNRVVGRSQELAKEFNYTGACIPGKHFMADITAKADRCRYYLRQIPLHRRTEYLEG